MAHLPSGHQYGEFPTSLPPRFAPNPTSTSAEPTQGRGREADEIQVGSVGQGAGAGDDPLMMFGDLEQLPDLLALPDVDFNLETLIDDIPHGLLSDAERPLSPLPLVRPPVGSASQRYEHGWEDPVLDQPQAGADAVGPLALQPFRALDPPPALPEVSGSRSRNRGDSYADHDSFGHVPRRVRSRREYPSASSLNARITALEQEMTVLRTDRDAQDQRLNDIAELTSTAAETASLHAHVDVLEQASTGLRADLDAQTQRLNNVVTTTTNQLAVLAASHQRLTSENESLLRLALTGSAQDPFSPYAFSNSDAFARLNGLADQGDLTARYTRAFISPAHGQAEQITQLRNLLQIYASAPRPQQRHFAAHVAWGHLPSDLLRLLGPNLLRVLRTQGDHEASVLLWRFLRQSSNAEEREEATSALSHAAISGNHEAQFLLASILTEGHDAAVHRATAYLLIRQAYDGGYRTPQATALLEELHQQIAADQ